MTPESQERPETLPGATYRVSTGFGKVYVNVNVDEDGSPFEVFINIGNSGTPSNAWAEALAKTISRSLRSGADPEEIADDLIGIQAGRINHDNGDEIHSIPDAVGVALRRHIEGKPSESVKSDAEQGASVDVE